jgi:8-oxo-dGTP pyrophosphatase MutT (NUDIX family)
MVYCNNCGYIGHLYRDCKFPVLSYGVIIFRDDKQQDRILMVQRRHSICYIEFLRGKYDLSNTDYIQNLINCCSVDEKQSLLTNNFTTLWNLLWNVGDTRKKMNERMKHEYTISNQKFIVLSSRNKDNLQDLINVSITNYRTPEWELPKGRRIRNEHNIMCATREFEEETGILSNEYVLLTNIKPFIEEYKGDNGVNYKHIYYLAKYKNIKEKQEIDQTKYEQASEIGDIQWMTIKEAKDKIRPEKTTKQPLLDEVDYFLNQYKNDLILKE